MLKVIIKYFSGLDDYYLSKLEEMKDTWTMEHPSHLWKTRKQFSPDQPVSSGVETGYKGEKPQGKVVE